MGAIEPMGGDGRLQRPRGGELSGNAFSGIPGARVNYQARTYSMDESWKLLSPEIQAWAVATAGEPLPDPFNGMERRHWYCNVSLVSESGPGGGPLAATSLVVVFGQRGLAIAEGTCADFRSEPGHNKWRTARFDLPLDPSRVRYDHHPAAPPNSPAPMPGGGQTPHSSPATSLLNAEVASRFGNLPLPTQHFLLHPFLTSGSRPQAPSDLQPTTEVRAGFYTETFVCYLFNASWVTFGSATRAVPYRSGITGEALWNRSPEASAIERAPWQVQAWTAPRWRTEQPASEVARRGS